jgi:hypothetical protein
MKEKIKNVIDALNVLITDDSVSVEPRTVGKLNTMKRYLLAMTDRETNSQTNIINN